MPVVREHRTGLIHENKSVAIATPTKSMILVTGKLLVQLLIPRLVEFPDAVISFSIVGSESSPVAKERVSFGCPDDA